MSEFFIKLIFKLFNLASKFATYIECVSKLIACINSCYLKAYFISRFVISKLTRLNFLLTHSQVFLLYNCFFFSKKLDYFNIQNICIVYCLS